jgi:hypothetical protein
LDVEIRLRMEDLEDCQRERRREQQRATKGHR